MRGWEAGYGVRAEVESMFLRTRTGTNVFTGAKYHNSSVFGRRQYNSASHDRPLIRHVFASLVESKRKSIRAHNKKAKLV